MSEWVHVADVIIDIGCLVLVDPVLVDELPDDDGADDLVGASGLIPDRVKDFADMDRLRRSSRAHASTSASVSNERVLTQARPECGGAASGTHDAAPRVDDRRPPAIAEPPYSTDQTCGNLPLRVTMSPTTGEGGTHEASGARGRARSVC